MKALIPVIVAGLTPFLILGLIVSGLAFGSIAWQPPVYWTSQFGISGDNNKNSVTAVASDSSGLYAGGSVGYRPGQTPSAPPSYSFISKYDLDGHQVWTKQVGNPSFVIISKIVTGPGGPFLSEDINGTLFLEGYGSNGTQNWISQVEKINGFANSMALGIDGLYAALLGPANQSGSAPIIVREFDFSGNQIWNKSLGETPGNLAVYANSNGLYIAGSAVPETLLDTHAFLSAYTSNGTLRWTEQFDEVGFQCFCMPTEIVGDTTGIYVAGITLNSFRGQEASGNGDLFLRKYDMNGNTVWTSEFASPDSARLAGPVISEGSKSLYLATSSGAGNGFILRYNSNGALSWSLRTAQTPESISAGEDGAYAGGTSNANLAFIEHVGASSSLVLFGLNAPVSFAFLTIIAGFATASVLYLSRQRRKKRVATVSRLENIPTDGTPRDSKIDFKRPAIESISSNNTASSELDSCWEF